MLSENMASLGGEQVNSTKDSSDSASQRGSRPSSVEKKTVMENSTIHWFAQIGDDHNSDKAPVRDREEKLRVVKERQNEERQRKIEELKAQAEAAQRYREQKEEERKRRIEELRSRDTDRRQQVEERKKAILEAEKERREYILRKNQELEAKLDAKRRNERSSSVFAFGSSTPRLLDPSELGNVSPSAFWGHRRSTSITNVAYTGAPLTRRSSERDLADGSKKRATSAGGIDRQVDDRRRRSTSMYEVFNWGFSNDEPPKRFPLSIAAAEIDIDGPPTKEIIRKTTKEDTIDSPPISYRSVARRKTDLMPTIPSPREPSFGSKSSLQSHTPRTPGSRSGEVTPGGSINTSRPGSAMSTSTTASVQRRSAPPLRKPRPASIAVTGVSLTEDGKQRKEKPPLPKVQSTPKRTNLNNSNSTLRSSSADSNKQNERKGFNKRESTPQKSATNVMQQSMEGKMSTSISSKVTESVKVKKIEKTKEIEIVAPPALEVLQTKEEKDALNAVKTESTIPSNVVVEQGEQTAEQIESNGNNLESIDEKVDNDSEKGTKKEEKENRSEDMRELSVERQENEMTASMLARKITTEEQAKAALAERRRLAREEAERQAELERQRLEAERQAELKRIAEEEERQRKFEEETIRLAEEQRKAEGERLQQAIEEAKKREEVEKLKREEEEKQRIEREEAEKKAKEEAEKLRLENAERLKREEKEREERRKRVEAIMSRTRPKGGSATPNSTPTKESDNIKSDSNQKTENKTASENLSNSDSSKESTSEIMTTVQQVQEHEVHQLEQQKSPQQHPGMTTYEQSVTDKENALMKTFSNMIIDENAKNLQNVSNSLVDFTNGKILHQTNDISSHTIANGNGHIENINKNDTNVLVDAPTVTLADQLIDLSNESQQITDTVNFTNNNSLLTSSTTLVNADSHESKEISLL